MTAGRILYSTTEVAEMVGADPSTVRTWCRLGQIHAIRMGATGDWRIPRATVDALASGQLGGAA